MRTRKLEPTPAAEFPLLAQILSAEQADGLDAGEAIRPRLRALLDEWDDREKEVRRALQDPKKEADKQFAQPAMALLGLTPRTEYKRIVARRFLASQKRKVAERTMRSHEVEIAEQLAFYLCSEYSTPQSSDSVPDATEPVSTSPLIRRLTEIDVDSELREALQELGQKEARTLTREAAESYRAFAAAISEEQLDQDGTADELLHFKGLLTFAERELEDRRSFYFELCERLGEVDKSHRSRYSLAAYILLLVRAHLPQFSESELAHLKHVAAHAGGQHYVFLAELEDSELGRAVLRRWSRMTVVSVITGPGEASHHTSISRGFTFIWELLYPGPSRMDMKQLNKYLRTEGGTNPTLPYRYSIEDEIRSWAIGFKGQEFYEAIRQIERSHLNRRHN